MSINKDFRTYQRADCAVFRKTAEAFGGLSNMAAGYPVRVNGVRILTVEALYQACRFPHRPEVQQKIIEQSSPMTAKMVGKPFRKDSRPDWDRVRVKIMRWVLRLKLATHWHQFSELLLSTGDRPIVEDSRKDNFWGAVPVGDTSLVGMNVLGRLLMELREEVKQGTDLLRAEPPAISDFRLFDELIGIVDFQKKESEPFNLGAEKKSSASSNISLSLFDEEFIEATTKEISVDSAPNPVFKQRSGVIADLKPYGAYKMAKGEWLGQIPSHWGVHRLKYIVQETNARSDTGTEQLLRVSQFTGVTQRLRKEGQEEQDTRAASLIGYKLVEPNELVINIMLAWNGSLGVSKFHGIASPAYCTYRFRKDAQPWFFHYLLRSPIYKARIKAMSTGVVESRLRLYSDDLFRIEALLPPTEEQAAIVRFLDWANVRLERTIRAKRRVIALLNEQKQAIIHRAVTRGLDPNAPLKPSGIAWLGDIPAHWAALQVRRVVSFVTSGSRSWANFYSDSGLIFLQSGNLGRAMSLNLSYIQHVKPPGGAEGVRTRVQVNDVLVCITGALTGNVALVDQELNEPAFVSQHVALVRCKPKMIEPRFLAYVLHSECGKRQFKTNEYGGTKQGLGLGDVKNVFVVVPSLEEQRWIVSKLDGEIESFHEAISHLNREIDLLREYRTRLVADVVTGKLDVREAAAALPVDDTPLALEPDALDADTDTDDDEATEAELND